jgi:hypothetical protein
MVTAGGLGGKVNAGFINKGALTAPFVDYLVKKSNTVLNCLMYLAA